MSDDTTFRQWAVLELMGHRRLAGLVCEEEIAGAGFLRLDVYEGPSTAPVATQFYSPKSVYCLTPTTEIVARRLGERLKPEPVATYELEVPRGPQGLIDLGPEDDDEQEAPF